MQASPTMRKPFTQYSCALPEVWGVPFDCCEAWLDGRGSSLTYIHHSFVEGRLISRGIGKLLASLVVGSSLPEVQDVWLVMQGKCKMFPTSLHLQMQIPIPLCRLTGIRSIEGTTNGRSSPNEPDAIT